MVGTSIDMVKYPPFFLLSEISCSHKFTGLYHFTFQKSFFGDRKNPIFRSTSNRGDGIVTYHSSSWESWDDFFKAKGCQIWGISWGKSGKSRDFSDFSGNIMEVLINLFSKQLEMNGEYDGDLVI